MGKLITLYRVVGETKHGTTWSNWREKKVAVGVLRRKKSKYKDGVPVYHTLYLESIRYDGDRSRGEPKKLSTYSVKRKIKKKSVGK